MARSDRPEPAEPAGKENAKPSANRDLPMAGLLASSPSKAIAANEFDPREAFYPKTLLTAEDLRGGAPAAGASAKPAPPAYVADPEAERGSPLRFLVVLLLLAALGGAAYWYFFMAPAQPAAAVPAAAPSAGAVQPARVPVPASPAPAAASGAGAPAAATSPDPSPVPPPAASAPAPRASAPAQRPGAPTRASAPPVTHTKGGAAPVAPAPIEPPRPVEAPVRTAPARACPPEVAALGLCTP
jgi:hypothetical protein